MEVQLTNGLWRTGSPSEVMAWLSCVTVPWWIAGGWALDLFVGAQDRVHGDLDVGVLRSEILDVLAALPLWEFFEAKGGVLTRLDARNVRPQDQADFDRVAPQLDIDARAWLQAALCTVEPGHKWISMLDVRVHW